MTEEIKMQHPMDKWLRQDRLPHIWCPGCGTGVAFSAVIAAMQESGIPQDDFAIVSGIGCSSRAAGYLNIGTDIEQARNILQQAGWKYSGNTWFKNGQRLEFTISVNNADAVKMAAANNIVGQLANFGINTSIVQISNNNYANIINQKAYQCLLTGIECDFSPSLDFFFGNNNLANYSNEEVINLINETKNTNDENVMYNNYGRIFDIYLEEAPYIGLYRETQSIIYNNGFIGNITPNSFNMFHTINQWYRQ